MDAATSLFSSLTGGGGSDFLKLLGIGSGVMGTVGNIQANAARNKVLSSEMDQMNALNKLTPAQIASGTQALEVPLSDNLIKSVGNTVQGELASRGLSQAPGIYASSLAQGLAPYQLQEQQMAQQAFFQKLGLPISARPSPFGPFPSTTNQNQLYQALATKFMGGGGGGDTGTGFNYWAANGANPTVPQFTPTTATAPNFGYGTDWMNNFLSPGLAGVPGDTSGATS